MSDIDMESINEQVNLTSEVSTECEERIATMKVMKIEEYKAIPFFCSLSEFIKKSQHERSFQLDILFWFLIRFKLARNGAMAEGWRSDANKDVLEIFFHPSTTESGYSFMKEGFVFRSKDNDTAFIVWDIKIEGKWI